MKRVGCGQGERGVLRRKFFGWIFYNLRLYELMIASSLFPSGIELRIASHHSERISLLLKMF